MATITTSIGDRSAENVDISSVSGSDPYTVTLSGAPSNTAIGDTLTDEAASANSYLITGISGADLTVTDSFGAGTSPSAAGATQATTVRSYSTMAAWEADLDDTDLYAASDDAVGECYNDSAFDEAVTINGGGTVGLTSVVLTSATGEGHDGTAGTGARIEASTTFRHIRITSTLGRVRHFEVDGNGFRLDWGIDLDGGAQINAERCIVHDGSQNTSGAAIHFDGFTLDKRALNCIVYDWDVNSGSANGYGGISGRESFDHHQVFNCTVYNVTSDGAGTDGYGIHIKDDADNAVVNCISVGCTDADHETSSYANTVSSNNIASDGNVPGSDSHGSETAAGLFVSTTGGSEDLHLKSSATNAIDGGIDLGTTPSGVEIDIDGRDRDAEDDTWDIGADEFVAAVAAGGIKPPSGLTLLGAGS